MSGWHKKFSLKAIGELPPTYLGGWSAATKTLNILVNLANSSHTDPYDLGIGIVVWIFDTNDELSQSFVFLTVLRKACATSLSALLFRYVTR